MAKERSHGRDLTGAEMAQILDEFVNGAGREQTAAFVEQVTCRTHRTLQQSIMGLFLKTIEGWAAMAEKGSGWYDARNEATVKLAKKICDTFDKYDRMLPHI